MARTVVFSQNFEAGTPLFVPNDEVVDPGNFRTDTEPCPNTLYPDLSWAYAASVQPGVGKNGSYGLWCPLLENDYWDMPDNFGVSFALMGEGKYARRRPVSGAYTAPYMWDVPPHGGQQAMVPLACQTEVNRIEFDFQLRSEAIFQAGNEGAWFYLLYTDNWSGQGAYGFEVAIGPNAETIGDTTSYSWGLSLPYTTRYVYAEGQVPAAAMDIDGAFHHVKLEWQNSTVVWSSENPSGASDGWARLYWDDLLVVEMVDAEIILQADPLYDLAPMGLVTGPPGSARLIYDGLEWGSGYWDLDLTTFALRGYENVSGVTQSYRAITAASLTSGFSRDFANVQVDNLRAAMVMREPANPAGGAWLELNFSLASSTTNPVLSIRDDDGTPVLEFSRNGTTLSVSDFNGALGSAAGVLVEGVSTAYRFRWCFSSYVNGVAQPDGYVAVDKMTYVGSPLWTWLPTSLFSVTDAVIAGKAANLPNYWSQIGFFPQGVLAGPRWVVWERLHPSWLNRPAQLALGYWGGGGIYDNLEYSYGESIWLDIADYVTVELDSTEFINGVATVRVATWAGTAGIPVDVRLQNVTDDVTVALGETVTSTTPSTQLFTATLTPGVKRYRLQVSAEPGVDVFAMGQIQVPRVS